MSSSNREGNVASLYAIDYFRTILAPIEYIDKEYTREVASEYVEAHLAERETGEVFGLSVMSYLHEKENLSYKGDFVPLSL